MFGCPSASFTVFTTNDWSVFELSELTGNLKQWILLVRIEDPPSSDFLQHGPNGCLMGVSILLGPPAQVGLTDVCSLSPLS